jgi:3-hydroxyisobutyrate dehydrogenase-like beta-hydroxyacid dehydrogenase
MNGLPALPERICFIGFGEAAAAFVQGWCTLIDVKISAYDIKTDDPVQRAAKLKDYAEWDVTGAQDAGAAAIDADVIISAVTADAAEDAARSVSTVLKPGQLYLDINSCAPSRKRQAAMTVRDSGADYVDVAVMAPVHPTLHQTPLLIGGPGALRAENLLQRLDMKFETISENVGDASTIKMVRSVMIKGIESLISESIVAAVQEGIDERVLDSLDVTYPGMDWKKRAGYMLERMVRHGTRRAEEMREVAKTMEDLGIGGPMATATAQRQQLVADLNLLDAFDGEPPEDHRILAQAILDARKEQG